MIEPNGQVFCDNTLLSAVAVCDTKALLRHAHGYTTESTWGSAKLLAGSAGHKALEVWLKGEGDHDLKAAKALAVFEDEYRPWSDAHLDFDSPCAYENCADVLRGWLDAHPLRDFPLAIQPEHVEIGFQVPLSDECVCGHEHGADGECYGKISVEGDQLHRRYWTACLCKEFVPAFIFYGRLDAIGTRRTDGKLFVMDHKFTTRVTDDYMDQYRMDAQMSGYIWGAQRSLGQPIDGVYINAIQMFTRLPYDLDRKCRIHGIRTEECRLEHVVSQLQPYRRTPEELEEWRLTALSLAKRYRALCQRHPELADLTNVRTQGKFKKECRWCNFKDWCEAGRVVEYVPAVLTHSPWAPFDASKEAE